jgi:hypothetical protein
MLAPVGDEYTVTLPVVLVSSTEIAGTTVVAAMVAVRLMTMIVLFGVAVVCFVVIDVSGAVVSVVVMDVSGAVVSVVVMDVPGTAVGVVVMDVPGTAVSVVVIVICGVTLSAVTGSTLKSIARNSANRITDDLFLRDIYISRGLEIPLISCEYLHCCDW